jgi:hypothetical protein
MVTWEPRKFDISSKLEEKRDGKIHFTRQSDRRRRAARPLWWTIVMLLIVLMFFFYLKRMM